MPNAPRKKTIFVRLPKRRNNPRPRRKNNLVPRNIALVQRDLVSRAIRPSTSFGPLTGYISCRINPFNSRGSIGILDGTSTRRIVIDHRGAANFTIPSTGNCQIRLSPIPNAPLSFKPDSFNGFYLNGITPTSGAWPPLTIDANWIPVQIFPEFASYNSASCTVPSFAGTGNPPENNNPYLASKFRIVSGALRLYYTGTALNASGTVTVINNSFQYQYGGMTNQNTVSLTQLAPGGAFSTISVTARNMYVARFDTKDSVNNLTPDSMTYRTEQPIIARLQSNSDDHPFHTMYAAGVVPVDTATYATTYIPWDTSIFGDGGAVGICGVATDFNLIDLYLTGCANASTFRVEVALCVEYVPISGSSFSPLAKPASVVPHDSLKTVDRIVNNLPSSSVDSPSANKQAGDAVADGITTASNFANRAAAIAADAKAAGKIPGLPGSSGRRRR